MDGCTSWLPQNKPRYVMGVGYPEDLVVSVALGADMFDCVWPTRTAVRESMGPLHSVSNQSSLCLPAFRQRRNLQRHAQSPPCILRQRLQPHRNILHMHMLQAPKRRWFRHHQSLYLSCGISGDCWRPFVRAELYLHIEGTLTRPIRVD